MFRNFYFEFNAFIELNTFGGHVVIKDSTFERFSSCGSVIRNIKKTFYYTPTVPLTPQSIPPKFYVFRGNKLQSDVVDALFSSEA